MATAIFSLYLNQFLPGMEGKKSGLQTLLKSKIAINRVDVARGNDEKVQYTWALSIKANELWCIRPGPEAPDKAP